MRNRGKATTGIVLSVLRHDAEEWVPTLQCPRVKQRGGNNQSLVLNWRINHEKTLYI